MKISSTEDVFIDTVKVVRPTAKEIIQMKLFKNSLYGKMVSHIHFTNRKENKKK